jgi:DNA-binding CsgD family transcriptional regulator
MQATATIERAAMRHAQLDIDGLSALDLRPRELLQRVSRIVRRVVPFDACFWSATDPATTLPFEGHVEHMEPSCGVYWDYEYLVPDYNKFADLARSPRRTAALGQATHGRPSRSARHRDVNSLLDCGPELRAAFTSGGSCWGVANLLRERSQDDFSARELSFMEGAAALLAEQMRASLTASAPEPAPTPAGPGTLLFNERGELVSLTAEAEAWLEQLPMDCQPGVTLPRDAYAVVACARAAAAGRSAGVPRARVRTRDGRWLVLHASCLRDGDGEVRQTALSIEPAPAAEVTPIVLEAYGVTEREREVTGMIARGLQTAAMAAELGISQHTVRDHVKSVLEKVGAASRGELVARIFTESYYPRLERSLAH